MNELATDAITLFAVIAVLILCWRVFPRLVAVVLSASHEPRWSPGTIALDLLGLLALPISLYTLYLAFIPEMLGWIGIFIASTLGLFALILLAAFVLSLRLILRLARLWSRPD